MIYQTWPAVTYATNTFINVPIILQFDDTPLISVVKQEDLTFTTEIPIIHSDGTYLARVRGTRVFPTEDGKKAGITVRSLPGLTVCELAGRTAFEIDHAPGDHFRVRAELYTPNGFFIKGLNTPLPEVINASGRGLYLGGVGIENNVISNVRIGVWLWSNGEFALGSS